MTSPREQAIEAVAGRHYGTPASVRAIIDDYERTRARIDGAKMMPREATALPLEVARHGERVERLGQVIRELCKWATASRNDWLISEAIAELKLWYRHLDDTRKMGLDP